MNLKKMERYLRVNLLGPGPRLMEKRIYRAAVSQRLRNTGLGFKLGSIPSCFMFASIDPIVKWIETNFDVLTLSDWTACRQKHICFLSIGFLCVGFVPALNTSFIESCRGLIVLCVGVNWAVHVIYVWWRTLDPLCLTSTVMCRGTVNPLTTAAANFVVALYGNCLAVRKPAVCCIFWGTRF